MSATSRPETAGTVALSRFGWPGVTSAAEPCSVPTRCRLDSSRRACRRRREWATRRVRSSAAPRSSRHVWRPRPDLVASATITSRSTLSCALINGLMQASYAEVLVDLSKSSAVIPGCTRSCKMHDGRWNVSSYGRRGRRGTCAGVTAESACLSPPGLFARPEARPANPVPRRGFPQAGAHAVVVFGFDAADVTFHRRVEVQDRVHLAEVLRQAGRQGSEEWERAMRQLPPGSCLSWIRSPSNCLSSCGLAPRLRGLNGSLAVSRSLSLTGRHTMGS